MTKIPGLPLVFRFPSGACSPDSLRFVAAQGLPGAQGLFPQLAGACQLRPQRGGASTHLRHGGGQHRAQMRGIAHRPRMQHRQRQRPARQALQGRAQAQQRPLARRQAVFQLGLLALDDPDLRLVGDNLRLRLLDAGGHGGGLGAGAVGGGGGGGGIGLQLLAPAPGVIGGGACLGQRLAVLADVPTIGGPRPTRPQQGEQNAEWNKGAHRLHSPRYPER